MSLSVLTALPSFSSSTCSISRIKSCEKTLFGEPHYARRSALISLSSTVLTGFSTTLFNPTHMATGSPINTSSSSSSSMIAEFGSQPRPLDSVIRVLVPRPPKPQIDGDEKVEVLVVNGIEVQNDKAVKFDVYIAQADGVETINGSDDLGELAGSLVDLARLRLRRRDKLRRLGLKLGIDWVLEVIGAEESQSLVVSLVPRIGDVVIGGMHIEYINAA